MSSATVGPRSPAVPALLIPATTMTRCVEPPVPSAAGASSLQSAVAVSTNRRPMVTMSRASCPAGVRASALASSRGQRPHRRDRLVDAGAQRGERVVGETGDCVEVADPGRHRGSGLIAQPSAHVAHRVDRRTEQRDAVAAVAPVAAAVVAALRTRSAGDGQAQRDLELVTLARR